MNKSRRHEILLMFLKKYNNINHIISLFQSFILIQAEIPKRINETIKVKHFKNFFCFPDIFDPCVQCDDFLGNATFEHK